MVSPRGHRKDIDGDNVGGRTPTNSTCWHISLARAMLVLVEGASRMARNYAITLCAFSIFASLALA